MSSRSAVDPELLGLVDEFASDPLTRETLPEFRLRNDSAITMEDAAAFGVRREERTAPSDDGPDVRCLVYRPESPPEQCPAYLHFHGGGYVIGHPEGSDPRNVRLAAQLGMTVVSVDYRLAPEHPAPAALDDAFAALRWIHEDARSLGIDPARVVVGGDSAGGGLAAALVQRAVRAGGPPVAAQLLVYPMLDDRTGTATRPVPAGLGEFIWTAADNRFAWSCYLRDATPAAPVVPARATRLDGLPPTWIAAAGLDLFLEENLEYARRLGLSGVPTELHLYPRAVHGFPLATRAAVSRRLESDLREALRRSVQATAIGTEGPPV